MDTSEKRERVLSQLAVPPMPVVYHKMAAELIREQEVEMQRLQNVSEELNRRLTAAGDLLARMDRAYDKPHWADRETADAVMSDIRDWLGKQQLEREILAAAIARNEPK